MFIFHCFQYQEILLNPFFQDPIFGGRRGRVSMSQPTSSGSSGKKKRNAGRENDVLSDDDIDSSSVSNRSRKKKTPKKKKGYQPKPGSAAYAIIIALYEGSIQPGFIGHMTKEEIIRCV